MKVYRKHSTPGFDMKKLIHHVRAGNKNNKSEHFSLGYVHTDVFLRIVMRPYKMFFLLFTTLRKCLNIKIELLRFGMVMRQHS